MTVKELKSKLDKLPEDMNVFIDERLTEFTYGLANSIKVKEIYLDNELAGEIELKKVVIISEE